MGQKASIQLVLSLACLACFAACGGGSSATPTPPKGSTPAVTLSSVATGFTTPLDVQSPGDGSDRLFVVEQGGKIRGVKAGSLLPTPFLDISSKVTVNGEMGLLGLAFHPSYETNRRFYVNYVRGSTSEPQTVIAEYQALITNPDQADPASERILLTVNQPGQTNHKGGQLAFGPDGFLYIGLGDGGGTGDPDGNGQDVTTLLGKVLRIDIDHTSSGLQYAIPADNPFSAGGGAPEIWAYGFRNPWRFSFDISSSRLFVGDVGQDQFEEVDIVQGGSNYGWNTMEGLHCFNPSSGCNMSGLTLPILEYNHSEGAAVIGGFVYRGSTIPELAGSYVMADFVSGRIWYATESSGTWARTLLLSTGRNISSLGRDASGEIYVVDYTGSLLKVVPQ